MISELWIQAFYKLPSSEEASDFCLAVKPLVPLWLEVSVFYELKELSQTLPWDLRGGCAPKKC